MPKYAYDKSERVIDLDGRLHVEKSRISKEAVNPYYGYEIPNHKELGLDENKIYKMYRPGEELQKAASTFNRIQILKRHEPVFSSDSKKDLIIGTTGSEAKFEPPYLINSLSFWDDEGIGSIEAADNGRGGAKQLSAGYAYTPDMTEGTFEGQHYDGIMRNIVGNHIALVESGRAGADVKVSDNNIFNDNGGVSSDMSKSKKFKKYKMVLQAQDIALEPKELDVLIDELLKNDEEHYEEATGATDMASLTNDAEEADVVHLLKMKGLDDEEIAHIVRILREDKTSKDESMAEEVTRDENIDNRADELDKRDEDAVKKALDSFEKKLRNEFKDLEKAKDVVRPLVDNIRNVDNADEVYRIALVSQSINHKGINELSALEELCKLAIKVNATHSNKTNPVIGMDEEKVSKLFPSAKRIKIQ